MGHVAAEGAEGEILGGLNKENQMCNEAGTILGSREMPKYKCHKEVWALKIARVQYDDHQRRGEVAGATLSFEDENFAPVHLDPEYMAKHVPEIGGYYVVYAGGYQSYSPAEPFESGYDLIKE